MQTLCPQDEEDQAQTQTETGQLALMDDKEVKDKADKGNGNVEQPGRKKIKKQDAPSATVSSIELAFARASGGLPSGRGPKCGRGASGAAGGSSKDMNKSDAAIQEGTNLLQALDDSQGIFTLTVAKWSAAIDKVTARLTPEALDAVTSGNADQKARGMEKISSLRIVHEQLKASLKLIESLAAVEGEPLQPTFMKTALHQAVMAEVKVSPAVHDILAVRSVTSFKDKKDSHGIQENG